MHTYSRSSDLPTLSSFNKAVLSQFDGEARVRVNKVAEKPFGPHPCIQFETGTPLTSSRVVVWRNLVRRIQRGGLTTDLWLL